MNRLRNTFTMKLTASNLTASSGTAENAIGEARRLLPFTPLQTGSAYRVGVRASMVHDAVIADIDGESFTGIVGGTPDDSDAPVIMHVMRRGASTYAPPDETGITVRAGQFILRGTDRPSLFELPRMLARCLAVPGTLLGPLLADRQVVGSAASAEVRVLLAHADLVDEMLHDLTPAGVQAARDALVELVKGVVRQQVDDTEPRLAAALARAAMNIADSRLADPDLSPALLARELNVSVRTLHRAFSTGEESVSAYIRRRRLERTRHELTAPHPPSISELAAHWQFADSSHFIRAFKKRYGQTPAQYARSGSPDEVTP
jgi:AraC family transcriptional activator of tynA and feaB